MTSYRSILTLRWLRITFITTALRQPSSKCSVYLLVLYGISEYRHNSLYLLQSHSCHCARSKRNREVRTRTSILTFSFCVIFDRLSEREVNCDSEVFL